MMTGHSFAPAEMKLTEYLAQGKILVADGAAGTLLMAAGLPTGTPPDLWNAENPQAVYELHRAYVEAGSQIILTNTFGANRLKLQKAGAGERAGELNRAGVELARQAAAGRAYVAGDIGPTGEMMKPFGPLEFAEAVEVFAEQAAALVEAGVDALWVETMMDLEEAMAAVTAARQVSSLPVLCSLTFRKKGRTMMGVSARQAAEELWPLGLAAIGANCGEGLEVVDEALKGMSAALPGAPLIAKPNAGLPKIVAGQPVYDTGPEPFAGHIAGFIQAGARIVGACCGSSPAYIEAIARAVRGVQV
jgi:5-methyltetrahydrofolate--homocysteine methyltransferase